MINNDMIYIKLGGRQRLLWFGIRAQKMAEIVYGLSREKIVAALDERGGFTPDEMVHLICCMLQRDAAEHGEIVTEDGTEALLDTVRPGKIAKKIMDCLIAAFAPEEDEDDPEGCGEDGCPLGL